MSKVTKILVTFDEYIHSDPEATRHKIDSVYKYKAEEETRHAIIDLGIKRRY
tara:strand:- start:87 stop:242 length:156 start_codon:yes stop_codon:yes gene_type:complete